MNKQELIQEMVTKTELPKKDIEKTVNAFVEIIEETLAAGDKIQLVGFGTFEVRERAERNGVNPQTKEGIIIPASKVPAFKAGKSLKDVVNG